MGQEIVYCFRCRIRLTGADLAKGVAFQVADRVSCAACSAALLRELEGKERDLLLDEMNRERRPAPSLSPRRGDSRIGIRPVPAAKSRLGWAVAAGAAGLLLLLALGLSLAGPRRPAVEPVAAPAPRPSPPPAPPRGEAFAKDLQNLEAELRGPMDREDFKRALLFLDAARAWRSEPAWTAQVDVRAAKVRQAVEQALPGLREKAVAAARAGKLEELKALRERAASWGREAELEAALADVAKPFQQGVDGLVVIEAEHFAARIDRGGQAWTAQTIAGAAAMQALPDSNSPLQNDYAPRSPQLDFPVRFARAGTHYVWLRGLATSDAANSVHLGLDGVAVPGGTAVSFSASSKWSWTKTKQDKGLAKIEVPSPGVHVIQLWMREDGAYVDRFLLTPSDKFVPEREGPPESPR